MQRTDDNQNTQQNGAAQPEVSPETSKRGGVAGEGKKAKDKNKEMATDEQTSSSESTDSEGTDGPDEMLIPEPGMNVWKYDNVY